MKNTFLVSILALSILFTGCGSSDDISKTIDVAPIAPISDETNYDGPQSGPKGAFMKDWVKYSNTAFEYSVYYPAEYLIYSGLDAQLNLITPTDSSDYVSISDSSYAKITQTDGTNALSFLTLEDENTVSPQLFGMTLNNYLTGLVGGVLSEEQFYGNPAQIYRGQCGQESLYKMIILKRDDFILVIRQDCESENLDEVLLNFMLEGTNWTSQTQESGS